MVAVTGRIDGRGVGAAVNDVKRVLGQTGLLQPGVRYELGGLYQQQQIAFAGLLQVFAAALVAEFVLLLVLYRRFWPPLIILGCALLSTTAVFAGLWLTHVELNITALMGMIMVIGIGAEMAIFYVSEWGICESTCHAWKRCARRAATAFVHHHDDPGGHPDALPLALAIGAGSAFSSLWPSPSFPASCCSTHWFYWPCRCSWGCWRAMSRSGPRH